MAGPQLLSQYSDHLSVVEISVTVMEDEALERDVAVLEVVVSQTESLFVCVVTAVVGVVAAVFVVVR